MYRSFLVTSVLHFCLFCNNCMLLVFKSCLHKWVNLPCCICGILWLECKDFFQILKHIFWCGYLLCLHSIYSPAKSTLWLGIDRSARKKHWSLLDTRRWKQQSHYKYVCLYLLHYIEGVVLPVINFQNISGINFVYSMGKW